MKKRQRNKLLKKLLSEDELKVIELYGQSDSVNFYKYNLQNYDDAVRFCGVLGAAEYITNGKHEWFKVSQEKIEVVAFLKDSAVTNND